MKSPPLHTPSGLTWTILSRLVWIIRSSECLSITRISSRASVWCNFHLFFSPFLLFKGFELPALCITFFFSVCWFLCLYRLCVYLNTTIFWPAYCWNRTGKQGHAKWGFFPVKVTPFGDDLFFFFFLYRFIFSVCATLVKGRICMLNHRLANPTIAAPAGALTEPLHHLSTGLRALPAGNGRQRWLLGGQTSLSATAMSVHRSELKAGERSVVDSMESLVFHPTSEPR